RGWRSPGPSASSARWCSSAAASRTRRRSPPNTSGRSSSRTTRWAPQPCRWCCWRRRSSCSPCCGWPPGAARGRRPGTDDHLAGGRLRPALRRPRVCGGAAAGAGGPDPVADLRARGGDVLGLGLHAGRVSALNLSLLIVAIVVPLNVVFGVGTALALARGRFRGKGLLQALVDLPFAFSP